MPELEGISDGFQSNLPYSCLYYLQHSHTEDQTASDMFKFTQLLRDMVAPRLQDPHALATGLS